MDDEELYSEFGASPLGKTKPEGQKDVISAPDSRFHLPVEPSSAVAQASTATAAQQPPQQQPPQQPDLYGDLYGDDGMGKTLLQTQLMQLREQVAQQESLIAELEMRADTLTSENVELKTARDALANNISTLFNTAKLEVQRKDDQIKELRERLAKAEGQGGGSHSRGRSSGGGGVGGGGRSPSRGERPSSSHRDHSGRREHGKDDYRR